MSSGSKYSSLAGSNPSSYAASTAASRAASNSASVAPLAALILFLRSPIEGVRECTEDAEEPPDSSIVSSHDVDSAVSCRVCCRRSVWSAGVWFIRWGCDGNEGRSWVGGFDGGKRRGDNGGGMSVWKFGAVRVWERAGVCF